MPARPSDEAFPNELVTDGTTFGCVESRPSGITRYKSAAAPSRQQGKETNHSQ